MILHPHAGVIFCDDIRHETNGKQIYIGVYNDEILFDGPLPWALPGGLWCAIRYQERYPEVIPSLAVKVRVENKTSGVTDMVETAIQTASADELPQKSPFEFETETIHILTLAVQLQLPGMAFEEPAKLSVIIVRNGEEIHGGRLRIGQLVR
ncbi:hypothetical protein [Mesorhizobium sp. WSM3626]|uniref:hypothetical protein n=1 Tax=Mesorhizobium sp. WSM3626 TaxID=1040987 RepID=UPI000480B7F5|nr:hypothetical protein [Mesorhizobium sp. WSM3626]